MREGLGVSYNKIMHIGTARVSAGRGGCNTPLPADTRCVFQVGAYCIRPYLKHFCMNLKIHGRTSRLS